jgi:outer membrane protein assembly factor BamB
MTSCLRALVLLLACAGLAAAGNWPAWRGPDGNGVCAEKDVPLEWSTTKNVRWKTPLPDAGNSTPVIWGRRVFLTQAIDKGTRRAVLCFDRADGKLLWQKETEYKEKEPTHQTNPYCSASPVTDGERVIASLGSAGMVCYDFSGKELWRKDLGKLEHIWGNASSPVLYGDLCILWCGPGERQFLLAVNKRDGQTVWQHDESGGKVGEDKKGETWVGSWSTPLLARVGDHDELVLGVPYKVKGFDPKTGEELWSCDGMGPLVYTSPVISADGIVVVMSGFHGPALAVRAGGKGDVTKTHRLWHHTQQIPQRIGSPVIVGEHAYILTDSGLAQCLEVKTGADLWKKERAGGSAWGSMVAAAGRLYVTGQEGTTHVFAAKSQFEELATNPLGEQTRASIAVADGEVFLRTYKHLWCIAEQK